MAQLAERFGLNLPDALTRDREALADLFERVLTFLADTEPQAKDLLLLGRQRRQGPLHLRGEVLAQQRVVRGTGGLVLEEVAQLRILADGGFQRERLARRLQNQSHRSEEHTSELQSLRHL